MSDGRLHNDTQMNRKSFQTEGFLNPKKCTQVSRISRARREYWTELKRSGGFACGPIPEVACILKLSRSRIQAILESS